MEEKIKIYVPEEIKNILLKDMELFEFYKADMVLNKNSFLNLLIINYFETYHKNNSEFFDYIQNILEKEILCKSSVVEEIAHNILQYSQSKDLRLDKSKKDFSFSLKPTKKSSQIIGYIQDCLLQRTTMSKYFRNMFASYCMLPQDKREEIIFREKFETIRTAIEQKRKIYFNLKNKTLKYEVSPFIISNSKEELFNYLLACDKEKVYSFRISRIENIIVLNENGFFDDKDKEKFSKMIKYGPQFADFVDDEICVRLTNYGKTMFEKMYVHRPIPVRVEEDRYYFDCSSNQVLQYFFRFGKHAYIESPKSLTDEIQYMFRSANRLYSKEEKKRAIKEEKI